MQTHPRRPWLRAIATLLVGMSLSCSTFEKVERRTLTPAEFKKTRDLARLPAASPYLKVHMRDGNVYVLEHWAANASVVTGHGCRLDAARDTVATGEFAVGVDSVAIFETNVVSTSGAIAPIVFLSGLTAVVAIYCATNPKACFGSCPTFYLPDEDRDRPRAEGFSASIAPSLEATDIDDLRRVGHAGEQIEIEMRNEAFETHVVRHVDLLALPRARGHRVMADANGRFWDASAIVMPVAARGPEGDCLELLARTDGRERMSTADSTDLGVRETIEVDFADLAPGRYGVVIGCRQSLLTTFLLYQTFAYMGREAGHWLAEIERGNVAVTPGDLSRLTGCIAVCVQDESCKTAVTGEVCEFGPIASDVHVVPIEHALEGSAHVTLDMTRGNWRVDWVALARIDESGPPVRAHPDIVLDAGGEKDDDALAALLDSTRALRTVAGDRYTLCYRLPANVAESDLFVEARGYYLEWIREEWMTEENPAFLAEMLFTPEQALMRLAPEFKRVEGVMERQFWGSRYEKR